MADTRNPFFSELRTFCDKVQKFLKFNWLMEIIFRFAVKTGTLGHLTLGQQSTRRSHIRGYPQSYPQKAPRLTICTPTIQNRVRESRESRSHLATCDTLLKNGEVRSEPNCDTLDDRSFGRVTIRARSAAGTLRRV